MLIAVQARELVALDNDAYCEECAVAPLGVTELLRVYPSGCLLHCAGQAVCNLIDHALDPPHRLVERACLSAPFNDIA